MSARERSDLQGLARMNARVAKGDVEAIVAQRLAEFEDQLTREWTAQELRVEELVADANKRVQAINAAIAEQCDALGIRPELRPRMLSGFMAQGFVSWDRKADLRRAAKTELEAASRRAKVEIDRQTARLCTEIVSSGIDSAEATAMLGRVSTVEELVPSLDLRALEGRQGGGCR